jgi:hypothetical protein
MILIKDIEAAIRANDPARAVVTHTLAARS